MDKNILENHALLSDTAESFLNYAVEQGNCLNRLKLDDDKLPMLVRKYWYPMNSWPSFISEKTRQMLQDCACNITDVVCKALRIEFGKDSARMAEFFQIPEMFAAIFTEEEVSMGEIPLRVDAVWTNHGLKVLELNVGSAGGWQSRWMDGQYRSQSDLKPFFETLECQSHDIPLSFFEFLIKVVQSNQFDHKGESHVLIMLEQEILDTIVDQPLIGVFNQALEACGLKGKLHGATNFDKIDFRIDGVYFEGIRIGAFITSSGPADVAFQIPMKLMRTYLAGQIYWPENPIYELLGDKRSLSTVYQHKDHPSFSESERVFIDRFIPWSVPLKSQKVSFCGQDYDLETLVLEQQDEFVIKTGTGMQGTDVFVGQYTPPTEWNALFQKGLKERNRIVQEFCPSLPFYGQSGESGYSIFDIIWGIFGFGDIYGGSWLRMMKKNTGDGVINSAKGAEESIVYEVKK